MAQAKYTLYKYVKLSGGKWRYCRAALYKNHTIKPNIVMVGGKEEPYSEGDYYMGRLAYIILAGSYPHNGCRKPQGALGFASERR